MTDVSNSGLLLLHLSDIHFEEPYCLDQLTDPDHPVRKAIINDIRAMVETLGPVDVILITGDIAHKGNKEEYNIAKTWLREVSSAARCPESEIYTVPGNHDVCRTTASERAVSAFRMSIVGKASGPARDKELNKAMREEDCCLALYRPMQEYNVFAAGFDCDLFLNRPFWMAEKTISPGWSLAIHGLTTTLFSGPEDDQPRSNLYLGALQHAFSPDDGIIRLAMLHHPPDWLEDCDQVDEALTEGCQIVLLGHKHRQRHSYDNGTVRLAAGAVNPNRGEGGWEPGYNIINLKILATENGYALQVDTHLRKWQSNPDRFEAKKTREGQEVFSDTICLYRKPVNPPEALITYDALVSGVSQAPLEGEVEKRSTREIMLKFWELSTSQRWEVVTSLDLLGPDDARLPETVRYRKAMETARNEGKFVALCDLIEEKSRR